MGRKLSAGIACNYGGGTHGYAVRSTDDQSVHMCEVCAALYDALIEAQDAWTAQVHSG